MRFFLAIVAAISNELLHINTVTLGDLAGFAGVGLGVAFYLFSILLVRHVFHYGEPELRGKTRDVTLGGGTFIVVWIMLSVFFYTIGL